MGNAGVAEVQPAQVRHAKHQRRDAQRIIAQVQHLQTHQLRQLPRRLLGQFQPGRLEVQCGEVGHASNRRRQAHLKHSVGIDLSQVDALHVQGAQIGKAPQETFQPLWSRQLETFHGQLDDVIEFCSQKGQ
ncbi:hypothetical protein D3C84_678260 [compost metagenome]